MTSPFSAADLAAMRETAQACFHDECRIADRRTVKSGSGALIPSDPSWGDPVACSFDVRPGSKASLTDHTVLQYDATVRLPAGTEVWTSGWIKRSKRFGVACDGPVYEVMGPAQEGPSATRFLLKRIEL
jgi:hypothetical protein